MTRLTLRNQSRMRSKDRWKRDLDLTEKERRENDFDNLKTKNKRRS